MCGHLERQAADLEATAHPALDALTRVVSTASLERVRRVKSRMVRLMTRVETIREVLQKYLDDDSDMKDLNLSAKCGPPPRRAPRHVPSPPVLCRVIGPPIGPPMTAKRALPKALFTALGSALVARMRTVDQSMRNRHLLMMRSCVHCCSCCISCPKSSEPDCRKPSEPVCLGALSPQSLPRALSPRSIFASVPPVFGA